MARIVDCGIAQVIAGVEAQPRPEQPWEPGQVVEVDQPQVVVVRETVRDPLGATVPDARAVPLGGGHQVAHHMTPRLAAARTPDTQPSSWKPEP